MVKPERIALVERALLVAGFLGMSVALAAVDWRAGLFLGSLFAAGSALDVRWRRP